MLLYFDAMLPFSIRIDAADDCFLLAERHYAAALMPPPLLRAYADIIFAAMPLISAMLPLYLMRR